MKKSALLSKLKMPTAKLTASVIIAFSLSQFMFYTLNYGFYDLLSSRLPNAKVSDSIVLIHITKDDLKELSREPGLTDYGLALREVSNDGALGSLILTQTDPSNLKKAEIDFFNTCTTEIKTPVLWGIDDTATGDRLPMSALKERLEHIKYTSNTFSMDIMSYATDSVNRRTVVALPANPVQLSVIEASKILLPNFQLKNLRGVVEYNGYFQIFTRHRPNEAFKTIRFVDVIEKRFAKGFFKGKLVIFGRHATDWTDDYTRTTISKKPFETPRTVAIASSIETIINNDSLRDGLSRMGAILTTFLISYFTLFVLFRLTPSTSLLVVSSLGITILILAALIFSFFQITLPVAHFIISLVITYYFFIPYRLIQESKKSWQYQQKNKLLAEVERLKTNFLSMMSHDLKTPLARIQGMADMALAHPENLTPEQKTALQSIGTSTDELTNFISGILDLGRVESQEVKLQLQARDINSLLEEAIVKSEETAKSKNIQIIREFEPLFSTKVDTTLMRQVFTNLIENAVKYSPDGSKILVSTEEVDGHIQVQVADQGIGIPQDEIAHVFNKFYRSHSVKNGPIKGSGLGLFLAKYFVELHKGRITVESVPQQGSTFTVDLPMN